MRKTLKIAGTVLLAGLLGYALVWVAAAAFYLTLLVVTGGGGNR